MSEREYIQKMLPWAKKSAEQTGLPYYWIVAQWSYETGNGGNTGAKSLNNHAGIKFVGSTVEGATKSGMYAKYPTVDLFLKDYARVMSLSYYKPFTTKIEGSSDIELIRNFAKTPWAETKYNESAMLRKIKIAKELSEGIVIADTPVTPATPSTSSNANQISLEGLSSLDIESYAKVGIALVIAMSLIPKK